MRRAMSGRIPPTTATRGRDLPDRGRPMTAQEFVAAAQGALQDVGRVLLEVTAFLVLSYLLFFAGSLFVAALQHERRKDRHERRVAKAPPAPAPGMIPVLAAQSLPARFRSTTPIDR